MSQILLTESCESTTITLTNGGASSVANYLKQRDARLKGLDVVAGKSTVSVEIDFGASAPAVTYFLLGNLYTTASNAIEIYYWNGSSYTLQEEVSAAQYSNTNVYLTVTDQSALKYKISFLRSSSSELELSYIFLGTPYNFTCSYHYENNRATFVRGEKSVDFHGYPRGFSFDSSKKHYWDVVFPITAPAALETAMEYCGYDKKPFVFYDSVVDTTYRLCRLDMDRLNFRQLSYQYYELDWRCIEI